MNVQSMCLQTQLIHHILYTLIVLNSSKRGGTHKKQFKPVKLLSDCRASPEHTHVFVCAVERCEVIEDHEQNLISSTSGEGRKGKYY